MTPEMYEYIIGRIKKSVKMITEAGYEVLPIDKEIEILTKGRPMGVCTKAKHLFNTVYKTDMFINKKPIFNEDKFSPNETILTAAIGIHRDILDMDDKDILDSVILHEVTHAIKLDGIKGHNKVWKEAVKKINTEYSTDITRCISYDHFQRVLTYRSRLNKGKKTYVFECSGCKIVVVRHRISAFVRNPSKYCCGRCKGEFKRIS